MKIKNITVKEAATSDFVLLKVIATPD